MPETGGSDPYVEAHLAEALATDPRVGELGLTLRIDGGVVRVEGVVPTPQRRDAIETVIRERLPEAEVDNRIVVEELSPGGDPEVVA